MVKMEHLLIVVADWLGIMVLAVGGVHVVLKVMEKMMPQTLLAGTLDTLEDDSGHRQCIS